MRGHRSQHADFDPHRFLGSDHAAGSADFFKRTQKFEESHQLAAGDWEYGRATCGGRLKVQIHAEQAEVTEADGEVPSHRSDRADSTGWARFRFA